MKTEYRANGIGAPLGMFAHYEGQATEQPVLYFLIVPNVTAGDELAGSTDTQTLPLRLSSKTPVNKTPR